MTPQNFETLISVLGVLAFSGMVLIGLKVVLNAWVKKKDLPRSGDVAKLTEAVESLREETEVLRDQLGGEMAEVQERLDFAERLLTQGSYEQSRGTLKNKNTPA